MDKVLAFLTNASVRRMLVFLVSLGTVVLNRKFGLELNAEELVGVVLLALGMIGQSAYKEVSIAKTDALATLGANPPVPSTPQP